MLGRVFLIRFNAEITELNNKIAASTEALFNTEKKLAELNTETRTVPGNILKQQQDFQNLMKESAQETIDTQDEATAEIKEKYERMFELIGLEMNKFQASLETVNPTPNGNSGEGDGETSSGTSSDGDSDNEELEALIQANKEIERGSG